MLFIKPEDSKEIRTVDPLWNRWDSFPYTSQDRLSIAKIIRFDLANTHLKNYYNLLSSLFGIALIVICI